MGNTASNSKEPSSKEFDSGGVRKSNLSHHHQQDLDSEFSDLILHEVRNDVKQRKEVEDSANKQFESETDPSFVPQEQLSGKPRSMSKNYEQFSSDLLEDEYNELNDRLLDSEATTVSLNILPHSEFDTALMDISDATMSSRESSHKTPTPQLGDIDFSKVTGDNTYHIENAEESHHEQQEIPSPNFNLDMEKDEITVPIEIKWVNTIREPISKVSIIGSFCKWRNVIRLYPSLHEENVYATTIRLSLGVHKLLYIVNNEYRVSDLLATATDQEGILFNWFEVIDNGNVEQPALDKHEFDMDTNEDQKERNSSAVQTAGEYEVYKIQKKSNSFLAKISKDDLMSDVQHIEYIPEDSSYENIKDRINGTISHSNDEIHNEEHSNFIPREIEHKKYVPYNQASLPGSFVQEVPTTKFEYSSEIPEMFVDYAYYARKSVNYEIPEPPQLPPYLNNVLLNKMSANQHINQNQNIPQLSDSTSSHHNHLLHGLGTPGTSQSTQSLSSSSVQNRPPLRRADSSYYASNVNKHLSIPNHVILNHLMTTSIKNDVLTVACITRYSGKFVTQVMHSPADI